MVDRNTESAYSVVLGAMAPFPAPLLNAASTLPFDGSVPVVHRLPGRAGAITDEVGRDLALAWLRQYPYPGRLLRGRDVLATAAAMTGPSLLESVGLIGAHLGSIHDLNDQSLRRLLTEFGRFTLTLDALGIDRLALVTPLDCEDFIHQAIAPRGDSDVWTEPSISTQYLRRTAIRLGWGTARTLGLATGDPTLDIVLPPRSSLSTRPLADDEEALGRIWAQPTLEPTRHGAAWALGQATATGAEQAAVTVADLDLDSARVWLHGNRHREPRFGELTDWGLIQIRRRLTVVGTDPDTRLVTAATRSRNARQSSTCTAVADVLRHAGLRQDRTVRPASLAAWAGAQVLKRTGRIDDVAHALGIRSLDRAAATIGWNW